MTYRDTAISHSDIGYFPSDGEPIQSYADRVKQILSQHRHDFLDHQKWWEHRGTKPCRICNYADLCDYLADALVSVQTADKRGTWKYKIDRNLNSIEITRQNRQH